MCAEKLSNEFAVVLLPHIITDVSEVEVRKSGEPIYMI